LFDPVTAVVGEMLAQLRIIGEAFDGGGEFGGVGGFGEEAGDVVGDGFHRAGGAAGNDGQATGEGFRDDVRDAVAVALGIDDARMPEDVGPEILFVDLVRREWAGEGNQIVEAGLVDFLPEIVMERAVADNPCLERRAPGFQKGARGELMDVTFLWDETSDGQEADRAGDGRITNGFGRKLVEASSGEDDFHGCAMGAVAEIVRGCVGGGVDEAGGPQFGFEERVAAVTINVVGVAAEAEWDAAESGEDGGGGGGRGGPDAVDDVGFLTADAVGAADGEDDGPDSGPEVFWVSGSVTAEEAPAVAEKGRVAEQFAGKGDDERGGFPPAEGIDRHAFDPMGEVDGVCAEERMDLDADILVADAGDFAAEERLREDGVPFEDVGDGEGVCHSVRRIVCLRGSNPPEAGKCCHVET